MAIGKKELDLIKKCETEVMKAFRKNAGRQAKLLELRAKALKLELELEKNNPVDKVLADKAYKALDIIKDQEWLQELKTLVADEYRANQKAAKQKQKHGVVNVNRFKPEQKKEWLTKFVVGWPEDKITTSDLKQALGKIGVTQNPKAWLTPLKLEDNAWSPVKQGSKVDGQYFNWDKIKFLRDAVNELA